MYSRIISTNITLVILFAFILNCFHILIAGSSSNCTSIKWANSQLNRNDIKAMNVFSESLLQQNSLLPCFDVIDDHFVVQSSASCTPLEYELAVYITLPDIGSDFGFISNMSSDTLFFDSSELDVWITYPIDGDASYSITYTVFSLNDPNCYDIVEFELEPFCCGDTAGIYISDYFNEAVSICSLNEFAHNFDNVCSTMPLHMVCEDSLYGFVLATDEEFMNVLAFDPINLCEADSGFVFAKNLIAPYDTLYFAFVSRDENLSYNLVEPAVTIVINDPDDFNQDDCFLPCTELISSFEFLCDHTGLCIIDSVITSILIIVNEHPQSDIIITVDQLDTILVSSGTGQNGLMIGPFLIGGQPYVFPVFTASLVSDSSCTETLDVSSFFMCNADGPGISINDFPIQPLVLCEGQEFSMNFQDICGYTEVLYSCDEDYGFLLSLDAELTEFIAYDPLNLCVGDSGFVFTTELLSNYESFYLTFANHEAFSGQYYPFTKPVLITISPNTTNLIADTLYIDCEFSEFVNCPLMECNWFTGDTGSFELSLAIDPGWGWVDMTNELGCIVRDSFYLFTPACTVKPNLLRQSISINPNPVKDILYISRLEALDAKISISDICGKIIFQEVLYDKTEAFINLSAVLPGIYFVNVIDEISKQPYTVKVIVQ